ncbi:serine hydrolase domain-containing protein [Arenimonas terrae]|uniref:Class A beta-lactamase-related serine hydrolase n=1 Tax=Arenimonas terrae TaxID=2546226 RepID=A0A5C4RWK2_9GAMM|nr:serine hydrolase domain-containing protein [Arenimonas terrae]TNJ35646.1 class A beta-lactamase-related serine hydrolase [Arenimonas terrae]
MLRILLLPLWLLALAAPVRATVVLPDTPAGRAFDAWLQAFNAADRARLETLQQAFATPEPVDDTLGYREFTGGFTLLAVESSQPHRLVVRAQERDGQMAPVRLVATVAGDPDGRLLGVAPEGLDIGRLDEAAAVAGLAQRARELAEADRFSGAWLVARDGRILGQAAHGLADRRAKTANTLDTRFRFGSAGKMFTAVAVLQLVEAGTLSLDGTVDDYLQGYPNRDVARVTLRQLLTHTGGTGGIDIFGPEFAANRRALRTHADYLEHHGARGVAFAPGTKVDYSNYGYVLLGAILENASGKDYYTLLEEKVFAPAGMTRTGAEPESARVEGRALAYRREGDAWVDAADTLPWRGMAAGGGYTTVGDLLKFAQALADGKLLSPEMFRQATTPQMAENWYGFGFITVGEGPLRRFGHGGDADGMNADFRVFPESGWVLVSLSHFDPPAAYRLTRWFEPRMPLERAPAPTAD